MDADAWRRYALNGGPSSKDVVRTIYLLNVNRPRRRVRSSDSPSDWRGWLTAGGW